ncbi:hypothetical protein [Clostridium neonatale]
MIENDDYIFIYINSISAIIIPINVFKSYIITFLLNHFTSFI